MFTAWCSPRHILPQTIDMPVQSDPKGAGAKAVRRRWPRPLSSWEIEAPGTQEVLDGLVGFIEHVQGDTVIWFDGAGFCEITSPILIGIGDGSTTDFILPHRHVFVSSLVIYNNGFPYANWTPIGGDGITCNAIRYDSGLGVGYQATAKYRCKVKCTVRTDDKIERNRQFRSGSAEGGSVQMIRFSLDEWGS